ncbi:hypothetical protein Naga_100908g2 [Nannochloropsis gaditana]|uniref:Golgin-84 n=1 Tax=Nannochloropsis gaditana TaxID=72520 RepID=W7TKH9_9STRA|nr:hypothetical protein Naga_100908g2 [Nannochloropsis gaditana]
MRQAQRREAELESTTADLTASLAAKQREIETLKASFHALGDSREIVDMESQRLQQELEASRNALEMERQHVVSLQRELRAQQHELSAATAAWREEKEAQESRWQKGVREREGLAQALAEERQKREELERAGAQGGAQGGRVREEMEVRVQALSEQLVRKQEALDAALSNVYAAEARFKASEARVKALESQLAAADYDVESPADDVGPGAVRSRGHVNAIHKPYPSSSSSSSFSLLPPAAAGRRVALAPLKPLSRLPFLRPYPAAADVADGVDKVFLASMHYLRTFPWVRLSLLAYLFLLHIYVFSVVGWQAGRIETIHSDTGGSFLEPSNRAFVKDVASTNGGNGV